MAEVEKWKTESGENTDVLATHLVKREGTNLSAAKSLWKPRAKLLPQDRSKVDCPSGGMGYGMTAAP